ncbi:hypothetical protein PIIN_10402 [Serendipita indica DSM 11827]|uniref:Uncharacterized protein n=1 Tax=Serendipita indica (strain DSM 11827) TaxID=1109443 RepID=G4TYL6_SERID|nr:hypothetical protein PIIN_10402 [Serendipita indica DSM 11827]
MRVHPRQPFNDITNTRRSPHNAKPVSVLPPTPIARQQTRTRQRLPPAIFPTKAASKSLKSQPRASSSSLRASRRVSRVCKAATAASQQHARLRSQLKLSSRDKEQTSRPPRRHLRTLRWHAKEALSDLRLPFLAPSSTVTKRSMKAKGWSIDDGMLHRHVSRAYELLSDDFAPLRTGSWGPPTVDHPRGELLQPALAISRFAERITRPEFSLTKFQVPMSWSILELAPWEWHQRSNDCSDNSSPNVEEEMHPEIHLRDTEEDEYRNVPEAKRKPSASYTLRSRHEPMFINEISTVWHWQPFVRRPDMKPYHMRIDQRTANEDISLLSTSLRMVKATTLPRFGEAIRVHSEDGAIPELGEIIANSVASDEVAAHWCRSSYDSLATGAIRFCPAGQLPESAVTICAAERHHDGEDVQTVVARLAEIFHPTLQHFVQQYLDTRRTPEDVMPPWMTAFGIIYDHDGLFLYTFYPYYRPEKRTPEIGIDGGHWAAAADEVPLSYVKIMREPIEIRSDMAHHFFALRQHAIEVCRRLRAEK